MSSISKTLKAQADIDNKRALREINKALKEEDEESSSFNESEIDEEDNHDMVSEAEDECNHEMTGEAEGNHKKVGDEEEDKNEESSSDAEEKKVQINTVSSSSTLVTKSYKIPVNKDAEKNIGISVEGIK